ncbi:Iron-sulfur cluster assembly scaffold protein IscU [Fundidesulfovibrio magnetotacticus]|uniref:Nitrogen fixation protein NifU n=1 Tax=Fundidesulfovibrio magnetotacticus TaxID=2730080 RepID=A0A6V8LTM3_9BACT|nr:Fe-S cluster assembly protein NifU [Fundidesulfovibrio magnetotacticus]GFK93156.1 Iron-sulfur cluster assembly scaffold protein IscU [Fundidesulfovibrio magnetotacticus]
MWEYTDKVREHFINPRNVGEIPDADCVGEVGSLACGDALKLFLKLDENERIVDAKFQTFGCASAIASSSALTEMIKGKTVDEALEVSNQDIAQFLGGLPKEKMHCSVMGKEALEAAVANLRGLPVAPHEEGEVVCECFGVTDQTIRRAIAENNLSTVEEITDFTKAGGGCGKCLDRLADILAEAKGQKKELKPLEIAPAKPAGLTNMQRMKLVSKTIEEEIAPSLQKDGGDIELVDVDGKTVLVKLRGACSSCKSSQVTLKQFVEKRLREAVEQDITVQEVR